MEKILGNYLNQPHNDFPLDAETLDYLQQLAALCAIVGNLAGDKLILSGCELTNNDTQRNTGYVFLKTKEFPDGEVLRWEGGNISGGMYLRLEDVAVTANGYNYPKAYTKRTLAPGVGAESFSWEDFKKPKTPAELEKLIADLSVKQTSLEANAKSEPVGVIKMWAGSKIPEGYALCNGAELRTDDYPELYKAIGTTFNTSVNPNGTQYTTQSGFFRLPDLRGRFVVGYHDTDAEYNAYGKAGGEKKHTLTKDEMPAHNHHQNLHPAASGKWRGGGNDSSPNSTTYHDRTIKWGYTESTGNGMPHENRPPFYTLAYIMKVK